MSNQPDPKFVKKAEDLIPQMAALLPDDWSAVIVLTDGEDVTMASNMDAEGTSEILRQAIEKGATRGN